MAKTTARNRPTRRSRKSKPAVTTRRARGGGLGAARSAARVAERAKPGWVAVKAEPTASDAVNDAIHTDNSAPELRQLKQKYSATDNLANGITTPSDDAEIVTMQPKAEGADYRSGRKAVVVQKNQVIGVQG
jgi:hypothetical protein